MNRSVVHAIDAAWALAALLVVVGWAGSLEPRPEGPALLLLGSAGLWAVRGRAHRWVPWSIAGCSALAAAAVACAFWQWTILWLLAATGAAVMVLSLGVWRHAVRAIDLIRPAALIDALWTAALMAQVGLLVEAALPLASPMLPAEAGYALETHDAEYVIAHPYIGHLYAPNAAIHTTTPEFTATHRVDAHGFRNAHPWPERADIVILGDSFTFGWGVEDGQSWPAIVAARLDGRRVVDLSLGGAAPQQYARVYDVFGAPLRPKLVIVTVVVDNDYWDAEAFDDWLQSGAGGNYMRWRDVTRHRRVTFDPSQPVASLENALRAYALPIVKTSRVYTALKAVRHGDGTPSEAPRLVTVGPHRVYVRQHDIAWGVAPAPRSVARVLGALEHLQHAAARHGARLLVVFHPGKAEVYLPLAGERLPDPTEPIRRGLDDRGIEWLDLGPAFRERTASGTPLFYPIDGHPNAAGYELAASLIEAHLRAHARRYALGARPMR